MNFTRYFATCVLLALLTLTNTVIQGDSARVKVATATNDFTITNPHKNYAYNFKGNLHAHSQNSPDGTGTPASVGQWYKNNSYYFYSITDHDYVTPDPLVQGIIWLGTSEEDTSDGSSGHMGHINIFNPITSGTRQERINNALNQGGFVILNHPSRSSGGYGEIHMAELLGATGIEVYNGKTHDSAAKWDAVLSYGRKLWGFGNDDAHKDSDRGKGYNIVNSSYANPSGAEIIKQIKTGNFYASNGFNLTVKVKGKTITASTNNGSKIKWIKQFGLVIKTVSSQKSSYTVKGGEKYVRIEVLDAAGTAKAWSQPLYINGIPREYIDLKVAKNADDGSYNASSGSYSNSAGFGTVGNSSGAQGINTRFTNVPIRRGTKISKAYLIFGHNSASGSNVELKVSAADENDSKRISSIQDWFSRPRTSSVASWKGLKTISIRDWITSPDIKNVIQEIINRSDWKSGNALQLFVEDNGSAVSQNREIMMREHSTYPIIGAARLVVYFDRFTPKTYAPIRYKKRLGKKKTAKVRLYWRVVDPYAGGKARVRIKIKRRLAPNKYKLVREVDYGNTAIGQLRHFTWYLNTPGVYKFFVYAQDQAGNGQSNIGSNNVIIQS